jgi:putative proteasome-type protease
MTYCVGMLLKDGLVMVADTRTNAGVDDISTFRKLHMVEENSDRIVVALTAGNLSVTQLVLSLLREGLNPEGDGGARRYVKDAPSMFAVAQLFGEAILIATREVEDSIQAAQVATSVSFLLGGRIGDGPLMLYQIYDVGNFIECGEDKPYLQIGESKYGKPIIDRALKFDTPLDEAVKVAFISFDSTMRSNLAVGRPLDLIVIPRDSSRASIKRRIEGDDAYFNDLSARWGKLLNEARNSIADPPFMKGALG